MVFSLGSEMTEKLSLKSEVIQDIIRVMSDDWSVHTTDKDFTIWNYTFTPYQEDKLVVSWVEERREDDIRHYEDVIDAELEEVQLWLKYN